MWMGWKPLSLTAYLPELESGIWEQTNDHFWKRKILTLSASSAIYHSIVWDSSTRAEQTPGWIKNNSVISRCAPPLPPFAVTQTVVTALPVQDLTLTSVDQDREPGGVWLRRADRVKRLPLSTAKQPRTRSRTGGDTVKREEETVTRFCCSTHWHTRHCCADIQRAQHRSGKTKFDPDQLCSFLILNTSYHYSLLNIRYAISKKASRW